MSPYRGEEGLTGASGFVVPYIQSDPMCVKKHLLNEYDDKRKQRHEKEITTESCSEQKVIVTFIPFSDLPYLL